MKYLVRIATVAAIALLTACSQDLAPGDITDDAVPTDLPTDAPDEGGMGADAETDVATDLVVDANSDAPVDTNPIDSPMDFEQEIIPKPVENAGVKVFQEDRRIYITNNHVTVRFDMDIGLYSIFAEDGPAMIWDAEARITTTDGTTDTTFGTMGRGDFWWTATPVTDELGDGVDLDIISPSGTRAPVIILTLGLRAGRTFVLSRVDAIWAGQNGADILVKTSSPLVADGRTAGALFLGTNPARHVILDNGSDVYFDYQSRIFRIGYGDSFLFQPGTVSNWSMAIKDPDGPATLVAGFLSNNRAIGMVRVDYQEKGSHIYGDSRSFTTFQGFGHYDPPRPLIPGVDEAIGDVMSLPGEQFYIDIKPSTPQEGLENWASNVSAYLGGKVWQDVPTGWNSWGGGGSSGGYSQDIFTDRIMDNFDAMLADFAPFGQKYFLIDDGWQKDHGDWITDTRKFPDVEGVEFMQWFAGHVRDNGLIPGLWIAPFWVKKSSDLYAAHPDWFAKINDFGTLLVRPDDNAVLDLTHPQVQAWLHHLFTRLSHDWGYKFIKIDFAYWALFNKDMHDPTVTASEAYVNALKIIRDAVGPDTFLLGVAAVGLDMGIMDSCRMTLDNFPEWGDTEQQSIKVTLATAAHRYYMSKVWVNHPDLLFFRPEPLGLSFQEARAWASFVAIYGGIVKNAEPYTDMHDHQEWLDVVRPMIPVYPRTARPLDLFELAFPEYWVLPVDRADRSWHVVGLFNWGRNEDVAESAPVVEGPRDKTVRWGDLGLAPDDAVLMFNVWDRTCEWATGPDWTMTAQPRTGTLLVVHPQSDGPRVVFTTRHLLGGAVEIVEETVTDAGNTLEFHISNPAGHEVTVYIDAPEAPAAVITPADAVIAAGPCDNVWAITFTPDQPETFVQISFD